MAEATATATATAAAAAAASGAAQAAPSAEQALSALLNPDQLTELITLISAITDSMHAQLCDVFDAPAVTDAASSHERLQKDAANPNLAGAGDAGREETEAEGRARRVQARTERDLPENGLLDLKGDALEWFQGWRDGVVGIIVHALNARGAEAGVTRAEVDDAEPPPAYETYDPNPRSHHSDAYSTTLFPPTPTSLSFLPQSTRTAVLSAMLLLILSKGNYAAPSRILLLHIVSSLHLPLHILQQDELKLAQGLLEAAKRMSADEETKKRSQENASSRRWKVGLAGVAGAALIGVTGGLAAPLVAGAIGSVMGGLGLGATAAAGLLGTLGSSGVIVGSLFGAYGYGMTSKMMDQYAKEVEDFAFLPMRKSTARVGQGSEVSDVPAEERRLRVTIGVSGWLAERRDVMRPWRVLGTQTEVFALKWELEALLDMGKSLETMVSSTMWTVASRQIIARTVFASLMFAMWPIALLKLSKIVDNPFNVAKNRADKAGLVLADAIINKAQGERPVTLVGYSMGARLIYSCLMSLAERRAFGLVESAVLIGAPAPSDASVWRALRTVVSGRLVNAYSEKDYVLAFLYRTSSIQFGVAGLEAINSVRGVENVDVSATVSGHLRYPHLVGTILEQIGWEDINTHEVEREQHIAEVLDKEEQQRISESDDTAPETVAGFGEARPALPSRPIRQQVPTSQEINQNLDPLGADHNGTEPETAEFEAALAAELTTHREQEDVQKFRCLLPECQKLFRTEHFWLRHVRTRHAEWLGGIKQRIRDTPNQSDVPQREEDSNAALQQQTTPPPDEEDLLSFDEGPKEVVTASERARVPERQRQQSLMDMTETQHETTESRSVHRVVDNHNDGRQNMIEVSDDEDSHGITMVDNEEDEITMLEPVPWIED